jgi:hypothetical protein
MAYGWFPRRLTSANLVRMNAGVDLPESVTALYSIAPALGAVESVRASLALTSAVQTKTTGFTNPDVPRQLLFTKTDNNCAGNIVVIGTNIADEIITETIALPTNTTTKVSVNAYKTITSIAYPALTTGGDWIKTGTNAVLGMPEKSASDPVVWCTFDSAYNAHTITLDATYVGKNLLTVTGATFDGTKIVNVYVITS